MEIPFYVVDKSFLFKIVLFRCSEMFYVCVNKLSQKLNNSNSTTSRNNSFVTKTILTYFDLPTSLLINLQDKASFKKPHKITAHVNVNLLFI